MHALEGNFPCELFKEKKISILKLVKFSKITKLILTKRPVVGFLQCHTLRLSKAHCDEAHSKKATNF